MEEDTGFSINTLFMGLCGITDGELQNDWKVTFETDNDLYQNLDGKTFCGYNDFGF